ncbi:hypothetical protein LH23_15200 [Cedecea neteri]|uniref:Adhesin n=1 Tax=Cedecea neteri TaxID=158822 RepID=A0AAN0VUB4_9ENTR|nr:hypothetical protein [Cedecea neteri]AIR61947.1 hypothetical protein LH23_15200 [Cedecea neteri]
MNKKIATYCLLAAGAVFTSGVFAEPKFIDEDVFSIDVTPTVIKTSTLAMNVTNEFTSDGNIGPNQRLFTLNISTTPETSVAVAAAKLGGTQLRTDGWIASQGLDGSASIIEGFISDEYKGKLETSQEYFPNGVYNIAGKSAVILLKGAESYAIDVTTDSTYGTREGTYHRPGEYIFSFIAQAYTE